METMRTMMIRGVLHLAGTVTAFFAVVALMPHGAMWLQTATYGLAWFACAGAYFGALYLWQSAVDALERRVREIVREELTATELRRYRRRLRFVIRQRQRAGPLDSI
ncbi:MAG: hypothetical protein NVS2B3_11150 [Vulcanimicrobiaceae bacterium]